MRTSSTARRWRWTPSAHAKTLRWAAGLKKSIVWLGHLAQTAEAGAEEQADFSMQNTRGIKLTPDADLPPDARLAVREMRKVPGSQSSVACSPDMIETRRRPTGFTTTDSVNMRSERDPDRHFKIPSGIRDLIRRARMDSVQGGEAAGSRRDGISGQDGRVEFRRVRRPDSLFTARGGDSRSAYSSPNGAEFEDDMTGEEPMDGLLGIPIFGRFVDAMLHPNSPAQFRGLALRRLELGLIERHPYRRRHIARTIPGRQAVMARFEFTLAMDHAAEGRGTLIELRHDVARYAASWALPSKRARPPEVIAQGR